MEPRLEAVSAAQDHSKDSIPAQDHEKIRTREAVVLILGKSRWVIGESTDSMPAAK